MKILAGQLPLVVASLRRLLAGKEFKRIISA